MSPLSYLQAQSVERKKKILWSTLGLAAVLLLGLWLWMTPSVSTPRLNIPREVREQLLFLWNTIRDLKSQGQ